MSHRSDVPFDQPEKRCLQRESPPLVVSSAVSVEVLTQIGFVAVPAEQCQTHPSVSQRATTFENGFAAFLGSYRSYELYQLASCSIYEY